MISELLHATLLCFRFTMLSIAGIINIVYCSCWKDSNAILLYKNNDPMQPANYRPIGLNNTMGKLWSGMVASVLTSYAEMTHILSESQHGFRAQRSCQQALNNN